MYRKKLVYKYGGSKCYILEDVEEQTESNDTKIAFIALSIPKLFIRGVWPIQDEQTMVQ